MALKKYNELSGQNPLREESKGTNLWLKYEIKGAIDLFNRKYRELKNKGLVSEQLEHERSVLSDYTRSAKPRNPEDALGYGVSRLSKKPLELLYKNLRRVLDADIWTGESKEYRDEEELKKYEHFNEYQLQDWSYDKWKHMVDIFGTLDSDILHGFGYETRSSHKDSPTANEKKVKTLNLDTEGKLEDIKEASEVTNATLVNAFSAAYEKGVDLMTLAKQVYDDRKEGDTQIDLINALYKEIRSAKGAKRR